MSSYDVANDEIVSFPVPKRYLPVVIRALADAMETGITLLPPATPEFVPASDGNEVSGGWTKEEIAKLKQRLQNPTVRMLLDMTAAKPEHWFGFKDLMSAAKRSYGEARGDLAGFTQLVRRTFEREAWPLQVEWSDEEGQVRYRMDPAVADWWNGA